MILKKWFSDNLLMLVGLLIGLYLFTFSVIGFDFSTFPGDLGDARLNIYFLEHAHQFFTGEVESFWNAGFMYPEKEVISYSDNLLGSAPIYSVFRLLGCDIYYAFQWWYIIVTSLNYIAAFYLFKYLFKNNYSALFAAFIFAFSLALQSQLTHAQVFPRFAIPFTFLMAVKFGENLNPKFLFLTILGVVYQIYCGIYLGLMLIIPITIFIIFVFSKQFSIQKLNFVTKKWTLAILSSICANVLILLPLMLPYMKRSSTPTIEHFNIIKETIPTLKSHIFSPNGSLFWNSLNHYNENFIAWWDHQIFAGGLATVSLIIVFFIVFLKFTKSKFSLSMLENEHMLILTALITFILYIRINEFSAYLFIYHFPGFSSMRSITRIINIELIFFGLAVSFLIHTLWNKKLKLNYFLFCFLFVLLVLDNYSYSDKIYKTNVVTAIERTKKLENSFSKIPKGSIVSFEPDTLIDSPVFYQIDAMLLSQKYKLKAINAYTATSPISYNLFWNKLNNEGRNIWISSKPKLKENYLYIVKDNENEKIKLKDLNKNVINKLRKEKLNIIIKTIKADKNWVVLIQKKAKKENLSFEEMLIKDAQWMIDNEK